MVGNGGYSILEKVLYQSYSKFLGYFSNPVSGFVLTYLRVFGGIRLILSAGAKNPF